MGDKKYVAVHDYEGAFFGTLDEILERMNDVGANIGYAEFYEVGDKVIVGLAVKD
tara:strand:+ start:40364 stop:40528 length:165 start_codon:yes stop_codon:yes gene_type:complete